MKFGFSNWKIVAEFVGDGKSNTQCSSRWRKHISPEAIMRKNAKLKRRMWDPWEVRAFLSCITVPVSACVCAYLQSD
jgi:hypothetical protein